MRAVWSGEVVSASDSSSVIFQDPASLIGSQVTLTTVYDTTRGFEATLGSESLSTSNALGQPVYLSQSLTIGALSFENFAGGNQFVRLIEYPISFDTFINGDTSVTIFNDVVTVRQVIAQVANFSDFLPGSLGQPFIWQGGGLDVNRGELVYTQSNFRTQTSIFSARADFRWNSLLVTRDADLSVVPTPTSALLLFTAFFSTYLLLNRARRSPQSNKLAVL